MKTIAYHCLMAALALPACGCSDSEAPTPVSDTHVRLLGKVAGIHFGVIPSDSHDSRGEPTEASAQIMDFCVNGLLYRDGKEYLYMDCERVARGDLLRGTYTFSPDHSYFWPEQEDDQMSFTALAPASVLAGADPPASRVTPDMGFHYTVPASAPDQPDLLLAQTQRLSCLAMATDSTRVPLGFRHLLTQVTFRFGNEIQPGCVRKITLRNVAGAGTFDPAPGQGWTPDAGSGTDYELEPGVWTTATDDPGDNTVTKQPGDPITSGELTLMLMPQTLGEEAAVEVEWIGKGATAPRILTAPLGGTSWQPGRHVAYSVSVSP